MNDWKKIEPPMLVLSLYSEKREAAITILSTGQANLFIVVTDDPHEMSTGNTFVGTLTQIADEFEIPLRILIEEYTSDVLGHKHNTALHYPGADYHSPIMEHIQGRRHRLRAQDLLDHTRIVLDVPPRKIPGTSVNWELNISTPKHNAMLNEHDKDLSQFISGQSIPSWVKWVCIDGLGSMYWFENEPIPVTQGWRRDHGKADIGPKCNIDGHNFRELIWERKSMTITDDQYELRHFLPFGWNNEKIPAWVNFIAIDNHGQMMMYEHEPERMSFGWICRRGQAMVLAKIRATPNVNLDGLIWERKSTNQ